MPANLPPHYYELEREFRAEKDLRKKLELAHELLALMPKHKGTDKLQADMKAKISKLKKQIESGGKKHGDTRVEDYTHIEKEGAGQVIIIGPPNSGKSTIVGGLTNAKVEIAAFPFSTHKPVQGMMFFENTQIQLIDTPPVSPDYTEKYIPELVRKADIAIITADPTSAGVLESVEFLFEYFKMKNIEFKSESTAESYMEKRREKKSRLVVTHIDEPSGEGAVEIFEEFFGEQLPVMGLAVPSDLRVTEFKKELFDALRIVRAYCKQPGKEPDKSDPVVLPVGGTVADMALEIHKDFAHNLKFAKVWGSKVHDGQMVSGDYEIDDEDIVELHI